MRIKNIFEWSGISLGITLFLVPVLLLTFGLSIQNPYPESVSSISIKTPNKLVTNKTLTAVQRADAVVEIGSSSPIRIKIPKIRIDAKIEKVGLTNAGAVDVPKGQVNAGWYEQGVLPGEIGSSIIVGHFGRWKTGVQTVFNNINKLRKGDKVYVTDDNGDIITFIVRESKIFKPNADASTVFISNDRKSHLNLITCGGIWNKISKKYSDRLIVFTDKE